MTTLLRIDASARTDNSISRMLADKYQHLWQKKYSEGKVIQRDITQEPVPHLSNDTIEAFFSEGLTSSTTTILSDQLIQELKDADHILISSPLYNLSLPSTLKSYFDHTVRAGHTFSVEKDNYQGLIENKLAVVITTRGGLSNSELKDDFQTEYLKQILCFIGIKDVRLIAAEGTALEEPERSQQLLLAEKQLTETFNRQTPLTWEGNFSITDQQEINSLRNEQSQAIVKGDAQFYADLCTDDVTLMIPGQDIISGRTRLLQVEEKLFKTHSFRAFVKYPEKIERHGDIAIELGRQEITMKNTTNNSGVAASKQKYMHVFRHTQLGWRYASLMSNPSE